MKQFTTMNFFPFLIFGVLFFSGWVINLAGLAALQNWGWTHQGSLSQAMTAAYELQFSCLSWFRLFFAFILMTGWFISQFRKDMSAYRFLFGITFGMDFVLIVADGCIRIRVILHEYGYYDIMKVMGIPVVPGISIESTYLAGLIITGFVELFLILLLTPDMGSNLAQFVWRDPSAESNPSPRYTGASSGVGSTSSVTKPAMPGPTASTTPMAGPSVTSVASQSATAGASA